MFPRTRRLLVVIGVLIGQPALHAWSPSLMGDRVEWAAAGAAQSCSYSLSATSASVSSTGTTAGSLSVVTGTNCSWTSVSHDAWITVTGGASGQGIGQVAYSVAANTTGGQRVGTMTIAGMTYTVTQSATGCTVNLSATSASVPATGSTAGALSVVTGTSCSWTAVSNAAWITVTNGASGTGIGQVAYTVAANTTGSQRVGTMTIAGQTFTVTQSGSGCTYSLSATSASVPSTGSSAGALSIVSGTSCSWTAVSNAAWITVTNGASGSGIGQVAYTVAANTTGSQRVGTMTIAGQTYTVTQSGASCTYSLSATSVSVPSTGSTAGSLSVVTGTSCSWTAVSNAAWITVTNGASGTGIGAVSYTVAANTTGSQRVGTMAVAGIGFTVTQAAASCSYSLSATSASVPSTGSTAGAASVVTGTSCFWNAFSNAAWITVTSGASGTGIGQVAYSVAANTTGVQRIGTMTIAGITFTVTQAAASCTYSLSATSASVPSTGSTAGSLSVVTGTSCSWTAVSNAAWITVTNGASGSGIGQVAYTVAANTTGSQRVGTMTIAGQTFTVTQAAASCTYSLSATSASVPSTGSTAGALSVVTGTSCSWTAVSNAAWITVTNGASGSGIGQVAYTVAANTTGSQRVGTMTIAGQTFTVTQAGSTAPSAPTGLRIVK